MGRRKGSLNNRSEMMLRALAVAPGETLDVKYAHIIDDKTKPLTLRDDAARCLAGCIWGRHKLTAHQERKLSALTPSGTVPPVSDEPTLTGRRRRRPKRQTEYPNPPHTGEPYNAR